jgi:hypothetical protein
LLTKKQNLKEVMTGGNPDRYVNQYEFLEIIMEMPLGVEFRYGETWKDQWGITWRWPEGQLGQFPVHDEEHIVIKDITNWREQVTVPPIPMDAAAWAPAKEHAQRIDRNELYVAPFYAPGIFEQCHHLMGIENALMALYEEPEAMKELIAAIVERELDFAKAVIEHVKPDAMFHHDDWGSQINSFLSPEMFEEFYLPAYKKVYGFYKDNGVELIVHHSDSFAANLVPFMIDMGIDIWQGVMNTNNIPALIKEYGGKITFMGGLHSGQIDFPEWTPEIAAKFVEETCKTNGKHYFIPCLTSGLPMSSFEGVYDTVTKEIDRFSKEMF